MERWGFLESADDVETLNALRKRPAVPREVCPPELIRHRPEVVCTGRRSLQQELEVCQERRGRRCDDGGTSPTSARPSERPSVVLPRRLRAQCLSN